ncbi:MAG: hypothetical protein, partial [Olavius algarvensis Gamma 1 endosymbiont]
CGLISYLPPAPPLQRAGANPDASSSIGGRIGPAACACRH